MHHDVAGSARGMVKASRANARAISASWLLDHSSTGLCRGLGRPSTFAETYMAHLRGRELLLRS